jgi:hypothetical protein
MSWPGDSEVPAKTLPNMTPVAPTDKTLTMSPEFRIPPSAMIGMKCLESLTALQTS